MVSIFPGSTVDIIIFIDMFYVKQSKYILSNEPTHFKDAKGSDSHISQYMDGWVRLVL